VSTPILTPFFLPPISWCAAVWNSNEVLLEAHGHYQKGSLRNRCHIAGPNGMQRLSIPLQKGKNQQMAYRDVRIAYDEPWHIRHWRSICTAYGSAPFFEHYADDLRPFFERRHDFLFDFNLILLELIFQKKLRWEGGFTWTTEFEKATATPAPYDWRSAFPTSHLVWPDWFFPGRYGQVFQERFGFIPNLSILDLLFCAGKNQTIALLQKGYMPA
jgi:hypothetical protein